MRTEEGLKVLFVSAEVMPFAKTGGLADVAGSLPKALVSMGNDVRVVMPAYKSIKSSMNYLTDFPVMVGNKKETCIIRETEVNFEYRNRNNNIPVYFVDNYNYYDREGIYCYFDDAERFAFFCRAVLEMLPQISFQPDIIHCNDWHTGPICMLHKEVYLNQPFYRSTGLLYTIHNLEYQGNFPKDTIRLFGMDEDVFTPEKVEFYGMFSFMKAGIVYSDIINTVSQMYAKEIQTPQYGEKMEGLLKKRSKDVYGIINGISYQEFDPANDSRILKNYDIDSIELKKENKRALQTEMGLPVRDVPIISIITRLSGQKGLDMVIDEADSILGNDIQFVLLGTGDKYFEDAFSEIKSRYSDKVGLYLGFNSSLAQRIYAGSDMFLMPSRFEPCGLGQIISFRYGTIPIVRSTGGLAETVVDYDEDKTEGNGFIFNEFSSEEMMKAINRALRLYNERPEEWILLAKKAMALDFSWDRSAKKYMDLYNRVIGGVCVG